MLPWSPGECRVRWPGAAPRYVCASYGKRKGRATMSMQSVTASSHPTLSYTDSLAASTSDTLLLIARILMGWIFVRSGLAGPRAAGMARLCGRAGGVLRRDRADPRAGDPLCRGVVASVRDHRHLELAPVLGVRRSSRAPCAGQQLLQEPRHNGRPRFRVRDRWRPLQHRPAVGAQVEPTAETDRPRGAGWDRRRAAGIGSEPVLPFSR